MTTIYLVRHAKAGDRTRWVRPDEERPLTKSGRKQAEWLVRALKDTGIKRIVSSPYVRCTQTVEPLGAKLGLEIELDGALAEGATEADFEKLLERVSDEPTVLSTHGDVIENFVITLAARKTPGVDGIKLKKGSVWTLEVSNGQVMAASYTPPD